MNDMKMIMEAFRLQVEESSTIEKVKELFSNPNTISDSARMDLILGNYKPGSYGAFAQSQQILSILKQRNIKVKTETLTAAFESLSGAGGEGMLGKISATVGLRLQLRSSWCSRMALATGVAGVGLAAKGLAQTTRKTRCGCETART